MARKFFPIHLRLGYVKNFFQSWYGDNQFYSKTWFRDLKLRRFVSILIKRGSIYKLARVKSKKNNEKSHWTLGNLWSRFSFYKISSQSITHILPKKGPQAFYTPFFPKKKYKKKGYKTRGKARYSFNKLAFLNKKFQ